jgi:hypothetical protein
VDKEIHFCSICGSSYGIEDHHIIFKSQVKPLDKCPYNHVYLCQTHHRDHKKGVHFNKELDTHFKMQFKAKLEELFTQETYSITEIKDKLKISSNATRSLCKLMTSHIGLYKKENIIRACLGGKMF